jgi:serine/threonine-protein kinase
MPDAVPRRIGRYDIITLLGEGGMARAYLAVNRGPGRFHKLSVIKQILPNLSKDPNFVAMFLDEARLTARLHHPNIVQTFDVAEDDGNYLLAMEYLEGLSLTNIYRRIHPKILPIETHLWVLTQVLAGLHYAHTLCDYDGSPLGVVHRDINPANVLVTYAGDVKILDFGVAKVRGALAIGTESRIKGKPAYCAPEQLLGKEPDGRADVFAVGVMLWEILAGKRLNRAPTMVEAAKARVGGKEPRIREVCPDVDPVLADICDRAMAMEPRDRFSTAAEFQVALQAYLDTRNTDGRKILVGRLEEAFAGERMEMRRLIERSLAEHTPLPMPVAAAPSPTPVTRSEGGLSRRTRIAALAVAGAAVLTVAMILILPRGHVPPSPPSEAVPPPPPPVTPPAIVETPPKAPPAEEPPPVAAPARPQATEKPVRVRPVGPVAGPGRVNEPRRSHSKVAAPAPVERAAPQRTAIVAPRPAALPVEPSVTPKQAPDKSDSAATPGTHLVRPARAVRGTVDERDPYSP